MRLRFQPLQLAVDGRMLALVEGPALVVDEAQLAADGGEARVGVVLAQQQAMLGPAGEHAVGFGRALRDEVIDQHAEVGLAPQRHPRFEFPGRHRPALRPASRPCAAASSYPVVPLIWPAK